LARSFQLAAIEISMHVRKRKFFFCSAPEKKNLRLKTLINNNKEEFCMYVMQTNKSTGEAQSANYLKSRTDYTTKCQLVNAKVENRDELKPA
jgi:hypothetical protein